MAEIKKKLNLGCGMNALEGYLNVDVQNFPGVNKVVDLNKFPWPFKDEEFDEVLIEHVLEHLDDVIGVFKELYRITKPGAKVVIEVPYFSGLNAVGDPTHKHFFALKTFDFVEREKLGEKSYTSFYDFNFKIVSKKIIYSSNFFLKFFNWFVNLNQRVYERFFAYIFPSNSLRIVLVKTKNQSKI